MNESINNELMRAIVLKVAYKPDAMVKAQAALLYVALAGEVFTADVIPMELRAGGDTTTPGAAVSSLSDTHKHGLGLITCVGRGKSPAASRNGAWVNRWRLRDGRRRSAVAWLEAHGLAMPDFGDGPLFARVAAAARAEKPLGWEYDA